MNKLLKYMIEIDELASDFYSQVVITTDEEQHISELFTGLFESRVKSRGRLLVDIKDLSIKTPAPFEAATEEQLQREYQVVFNKAALLSKKPIPSIKELLDFTMELELTGLGKQYSVTIDALRESSRALIPIAAATQWRRRFLETYLTSTHEYPDLLNLFNELPSIWTENLLVADDSMATATLLSDTLSCEGSVHTAGNGVSAMDKLEKNYFAAIISDVSMPLMGGVDFYRSAEKKYPGIGQRFIFFTDTASMNDIDFFKFNKINYLPKPSSIKDIRRTVMKVMGRH